MSNDSNDHLNLPISSSDYLTSSTLHSTNSDTSMPSTIEMLPWYKRSEWKKVKIYPLLIAILIFALLLIFPITKTRPSSNMAAILALVSVLWGTEAIPVVATAMFIPLPVIILGVILDPTTGKPFPASKAATMVSDQFFDPVVILFLGGFTIAAALQRFHISQKIASWTLEKAGTKPRNILLSIMFLSMILSLFITNVAASIICVSAVSPIVKHELAPNDPYIQAILLGVAFASNIGGMISINASPQNAIAIHTINAIDPTVTISFIDWLLVAAPFCIVLLLICWVWLLWMFPANVTHISISTSKSASLQIPFTSLEKEPSETDTLIPRSRASRSSILSTDQPYHSLENGPAGEMIGHGIEPTEEEKTFEWNTETYIVVITTLITVVLWVTEPLHIQWTGNIGIVALLPVVMFFGTGILTTKDFDTLTWSVLLLMGGGLALGFSISSSQLLTIAADSLGHIVAHSSVWVVLLAFSFMMGLIANFISSTVAAVIILPVVAAIGVQHHHLRMLTMLAALMTSGSMALPVSSFPNANSFSVTNEESIPYVSTGQYIKAGLPMTLFSVAAVVSIGYGLTSAMGY